MGHTCIPSALLTPPRVIKLTLTPQLHLHLLVGSCALVGDPKVGVWSAWSAWGGGAWGGYGDGESDWGGRIG